MGWRGTVVEGNTRGGIRDVAIMSLLSIVKRLFSSRVSVTISGADRCVCCQPDGHVSLGVEPNSEIGRKAVTCGTLKARREISRFVSHSMFNIPCRNVTIPFLRRKGLRNYMATVFPTLASNGSIIAVGAGSN